MNTNFFIKKIKKIMLQFVIFESLQREVKAQNFARPRSIILYM